MWVVRLWRSSWSYCWSLPRCSVTQVGMRVEYTCGYHTCETCAWQSSAAGWQGGEGGGGRIETRSRWSPALPPALHLARCQPATWETGQGRCSEASVCPITQKRFLLRLIALQVCKANSLAYLPRQVNQVQEKMNLHFHSLKEQKSLQIVLRMYFDPMRKASVNQSTVSYLPRISQLCRQGSHFGVTWPRLPTIQLWP